MAVTERATRTAPQLALRRARLATSLIFVLLGLFQGVLAARMPAIKQHGGLGDGSLGIALLGYSIGSISAIQYAGGLIARFGSSAATAGGLITASLAFPLIPLTHGLSQLITVLGVYGAGLGMTDTAMNAHAVLVERGYHRSIMSSFHGFASLGMLIGAGIGSLSADLGLPLAALFAASGGVCLLATIAARPFMLPGSPGGPATSRAERAHWTLTLALLALVAFLALLTEWAIGNWSAVYLHDNLYASSSFAGYGFGVFASMMVLARFFGDRAISRLGPIRLLRAGGLLTGAALLAGLLSDRSSGFVVACGAVGIGMAAVVPLVFSAAGNLPGLPSAGAVSKVIAVGYAGGMAGPPVIGLLAALTSLKAALMLVAAAGLVIGAAGPAALRQAKRGAAAG